MATSGLAVLTESRTLRRSPEFQDVFEQYADTVYLTALRVTGNPADAEDVLQIVFLRLLNHPDRFDPARGGPAYFRRAATNASIDILRRRKALPESSLDGSDPIPAKGESPILKQRLRQAIARLPDKDAELFVLRAVEGLSVAELAEHYGIERNTIGSRLFRIRQNLQKWIGE